VADKYEAWPSFDAHADTPFDILNNATITAFVEADLTTNCPALAR